MAQRDSILTYVKDVLDVETFKDYGPQGAQLIGLPDVYKLVGGVSCSMRLFEEAVNREADMIITHHGLFWDHESRILDEMKTAQIKYLLENGITLASYHLPLDANMELGNNVLVAKMIDIQPNVVDRFADIGVGVELHRHMHLDAIEYMLARHGHMPLLHKFVDDCPETVQRVAIVTGRGGRYFEQAINEGYDLFITGEGEEWAQAMSRENRVAFFAAGHYNSERLGVEALCRTVAEKFHLDWSFVDVPNTV